jgi:hypothetical protein
MMPLVQDARLTGAGTQSKAANDSGGDKTKELGRQSAKNTKTKKESNVRASNKVGAKEENRIVKELKKQGKKLLVTEH